MYQYPPEVKAYLEPIPRSEMEFFLEFLFFLQNSQENTCSELSF